MTAIRWEKDSIESDGLGNAPLNPSSSLPSTNCLSALAGGKKFIFPKYKSNKS